MVLRLVTFNIRHGRPQGAPASDPVRLAAAVADLDADVLALQEVDVAVPRSGGIDLAAVAADAVGGRVVHFAPAIPLDGGSYGNALVVRGRLTDVEDLPLPGEGEPRVLTLARVAVAGTSMTVGVTHLQAPRRGRTDVARRQLPVVLDHLVGRPGPWALLGDLNLEPPEVEPVLADRGFTPVTAPPTFPAVRPERRIDWIALRGTGAARAAVPDLRASDHRPLVAEVDPP
ncbi:MAG: endonuclease/exonuclease/phosphatase family protein [Microthrixaceae bacterium]